MNMIYKVFADESFVEESTKIATTLSQMPTLGLALAKQALNKSFTNNWQQQLNVEDQLQQQAALTDDYAEGINSFLEKRKPIFDGK
jgi:2-(1,2-epoxy-1,2-dihydrophenyl)acetyl-CoA isomerase